MCRERIAQLGRSEEDNDEEIPSRYTTATGLSHLELRAYSQRLTGTIGSTITQAEPRIVRSERKSVLAEQYAHKRMKWLSKPETQHTTTAKERQAVPWLEEKEFVSSAAGAKGQRRGEPVAVGDQARFAS